MKPQGWDEFLKQIIQEYDLTGRLKDIFLVRFQYENWRKKDEEIWELAQAPSHETYKKYMTQVYSKFSKDKENGCPELELNNKGPGKYNILLSWFKDIKYTQWRQNPGLVAPTQSLNNKLYIERPPVETECYEEITKFGSLLRIKAPEKMGKTYLVNQLISQNQIFGFQTVYINLQTAETSILSSLDKFLRWFSANVSRELKLKPLLDDYWDEELYGSLMSCKTYFQSYILEQISTPLILALDNVDKIFEHPEIAQDFLQMLRVWHEEANNLELWKQLRLVIAYSTEAYIKLDINQSPFNVGKEIKLPFFTLEQIKQLALYRGLSMNETAENFLVNLTELVGGHPYLINLAIEEYGRENSDPDKILAQAPTQGGIYSAHLLRHWRNLQQQPSLMAAMKDVMEAEGGVKLDPTLGHKLEGMGLITIEGDAATVTLELYRRYFCDRL
ncbi:MAG: hypothetical protein N5P05_002130 [Chroococcopsis gigantea SAG 12.99]|jgi:hypothetical protein|nr:AAA-like domain-containing protein [Chlorogloea purpurea SAG 13.99]MDV3000524.1 hypothetical protein [Chroococcopsis gigantea SAG 12.99]